MTFIYIRAHKNLMTKNVQACHASAIVLCDMSARACDDVMSIGSIYRNPDYKSNSNCVLTFNLGKKAKKRTNLHQETRQSFS